MNELWYMDWLFLSLSLALLSVSIYHVNKTKRVFAHFLLTKQTKNPIIMKVK